MSVETEAEAKFRTALEELRAKSEFAMQKVGELVEAGDRLERELEAIRNLLSGRVEVRESALEMVERFVADVDAGLTATATATLEPSPIRREGIHLDVPGGAVITITTPKE